MCQQSWWTQEAGRVSARCLDDEVQEMVVGNEKPMLVSQTDEEQSRKDQDMAVVHVLVVEKRACDPVVAGPILPSWREYSCHDTEHLSVRRHLDDSVAEVLIGEDSEYHASCC